MKHQLLLVFTFLAIGISALYSQDTTNKAVMKISLEQAKEFASKNNYDVINAMKDIEIARKQMTEATATGLPQISASVAYNNFLSIPTQLIPGEFFGEEPGTFIPVKFGTQHNMTLSGTVNQLIFSVEYIVALQATKAFINMSNKQYEKQLIELERNVSESYYLVLIAERNLKIVEETLKSLTEIRDANAVLFENGFVEDVDVDQTDLLLTDLQATLINIRNNLEVSKNLLKFQMGLKLENEIELTDNLDVFLDQIEKDVLVENEFNYNNNIDYQILLNQQELAHLNMKRYNSQYLPRLYGYLTYSENAQRNEWNFFESNQDWFNSSILGVQMDIPIFASGGRSARVSQAKIQMEKLDVMGDKLRSGLDIQYSTYRNNFINSWKVYKNKELALQLSDKIYNRTKTKVLEGVSSSIELQQNYNQYLNSEREYIMAMLELLVTKLELDKLTR